MLNPFRAFREKRTMAKFERAENALANGDFELAKKLGEELLRSKFSGGYEICARVAHNEGNAQEALRIMREGISLAPGAWRMWLEYGIFASYANEVEEAYMAFDKGLSFQEADTDIIRVNIATTAIKRKDYDRARKQLDLVGDDYHFYKNSLYANVLLNKGNKKQAQRIIEDLFSHPDITRNVEHAKTFFDLICDSEEYFDIMRSKIPTLPHYYKTQDVILYSFRNTLGAQDNLSVWKLQTLFDNTHPEVVSPNIGAYCNAIIAATTPYDGLNILKEYAGFEGVTLENYEKTDDSVSHAGPYFLSGLICFDDDDSSE